MSCCSACGKHACRCGCGASAGTPLRLYNRPGLDSLAYRVGSYADFHATMQHDLSVATLPALAGLRTREADDPAMALLDAWAVGADVLSFYQERIANEGYLRTATERRSILELAQLVDYRLRPGVAASVYLAYTVEKDSPPVTIAAGARAQSIPAPGEQMQTFETAEPLDARYEFSALKPRLTRPQVVTRASLDRLTDIGFQGATNHLKANDWLVFEFADGRTPAVRQIQHVAADAVQQRTQVTLQPALTDATGDATGTAPLSTSPASIAAVGAPMVEKASSPFIALVDALKRPTSLQPANASRLSRSMASALGNASDVRPQLLLNFEAALAGTFYAAWSGAPVRGDDAQVRNIYVQRLAAAKFGYNTPFKMKLVKDGETYQAQADTDWESVETADTLFLDNAYDGIRAGSYVIVSTPGDGVAARVEVHKVNSAAIHPRTAYGISGKTTELLLDRTTSAPTDMLARINHIQYITQTVRIQQVFAQSDPLQLAELAISDSVGSSPAKGHASGTHADGNTRLELAAAIDGLTAGRWVIVEGRRSDVPGTDAVIAAELVMLAAVEQGVDALVPGDTVHSTLVFANQGLAYRYRRDSVAVYANVVRATHGETRNEVLGSGNGALSMQTFVLKQSPLTQVSAATADGVQSTLDVRVNDMTWHETRNLAFVGASDRRFATATDDAGKTTVVFGDGMHGARLPTGVENIVASYRNGIGTPGNVNAQQISLLATRPLGVKAVINPLRASGGADAETRDQARRHVPLAVLALDRLVSVPDYADFARSFGGVGKASAIKLGNLVQVTIAGAADAAIDVTSELYRNLRQALTKYGDPSLPLRLDVRELLALTLSAKVGLAPDVVWESVEPQLRAALLGAFGFEQRALAQDVYLSEIIACMQAIHGVAWVDVDAFGSIDEATLLVGFGAAADSDNGDDGTVMKSPATVPGLSAAASAMPAPRVQVHPGRHDVTGNLLPAQLAYFPPNVPDTLLLQEVSS